MESHLCEGACNLWIAVPSLPLTLTILLYNKTRDLEHVDEARKELFCRKAKLMENIPPALDALIM